MRIRSRTLSPVTDCGYGQVFTRVYTQGTFPPFKSESTFVSKVPVLETSETMSDVVFQRPEVVIDPLTGMWKRTKRNRKSIYDDKTSADGHASRLLGANRKFLPVKPCTHTKTKQGLYSPSSVIVKYGRTTGSGSLERTDTSTYSFSTPAGRLLHLFSTSNMSQLISNSAQSYTSDDYQEHDWFALNSQFREKLEQFTESNFFIGEAMYESDIFVDAFKILVNPTNAIKVLLKNLGKDSTSSLMSNRQRGKFRRMNLGEFSRSVKGLGMKAIDWDLFYKFAVVPAIHDVKATLAAHREVGGRMKYLRQNGGSYIPTRVRDILVSPHVNVPPVSTFGTTNPTTCFVTMLEKKSTATIGAWCRVREDLNWSDDWSAYLQYFGVNKMIGLAWELIPCSFVLDWFTDTQEILNNQTRLRTGSPFVSIKGLCASVKKTTKLELRLNPGRNNSVGYNVIEPSDQIVIGTQRIDSYSRFSSIPETAGVVDLSTLGLFQWATLGELTLKLWPH